MQLKLNKGFKKKLEGMFEKYQFEVGILDDSVHKEAVETRLFGEPDLKSYAGGPICKTSNKYSSKSISEVFIENQTRLGIDMLRDPLNKKNSDIVKFSTAFLKMVVGNASGTKRIENLLQAIIRNPILRGDYGSNTPATADAKGFNRGLIDTAQMFKAIRARIIR